MEQPNLLRLPLLLLLRLLLPEMMVLLLLPVLLLESAHARQGVQQCCKAS
jgi:hypothetical protein